MLLQSSLKKCSTDRWGRRKKGFTYHKKSRLSLIFGVFIGLVLVETFAFHILVERWSPIVAWIGTSLSLYSMIQIIGIIKSASRIPIILEDKKVLLRFGIMSETEVLYEDIKKVRFDFSSQALTYKNINISQSLT